MSEGNEPWYDYEKLKELMRGGKQYNFIVGGRGMGRKEWLERELESFKEITEKMSGELHCKNVEIQDLKQRVHDITLANGSTFRELGKQMEINTKLVHQIQFEKERYKKMDGDNGRLKDEIKELKNKLRNIKLTMSSFYCTVNGVDTDAVYVANTEANNVIARVKRKIVEENKDKIVEIQPDIYFMAEKIEKLEKNLEDAKHINEMKSERNVRIIKELNREKKAYSAMESENQLLHNRMEDMVQEMHILETRNSQLEKQVSNWQKDITRVRMSDKIAELVADKKELEKEQIKLESQIRFGMSTVRMVSDINDKLIEENKRLKNANAFLRGETGIYNEN